MKNYWQLKRNDTNEIVRFDQDMRWVDEYDWSRIAQASPVRTLSGALDIQQGTKQSGRPITLTGDWVWHKRSDLLKLRDWTDIPELEMTLTHYDGRKFNVIYRLHEAAMQATPVLYMTPENENDPYTVTINLMEF